MYWKWRGAQRSSNKERRRTILLVSCFIFNFSVFVKEVNSSWLSLR
ncbi:unnamed protein product, partial [Linum tenue]